MRNLVNINTKKTPYLLGYCNESNCDNEITLQIEIEDVINPYLEITLIDGTIQYTEILTITNNLINYTLPVNLYDSTGTLKLRVLADDYTSEYINFNIQNDLTDTDDVIVKIDSNENYIIRKLKSYKYSDFPLATKTSSGAIIVGDNLEIDSNGVLSATGGGTSTAATIEVGKTTTGEPGTNAQVTNSGTKQNAIFNFVIPRGANGIDGDDGIDGTDGREIELQKTSTYIQWRYVGDSNWNNLIALSDIKGEQGIQGEQGPKGDKGDTGEQGLQGIQGEIGPQGIQGETGPQGIQGEVGPKGDKGDTGSQGIQGEQGPIGETGPQGPKGDKGDTGEQGPQGIQGEKGDKGDKGDTFTFADFTDEQLSQLKTDITTYYSEYKSVYTTTTDGETEIPINIAGYRNGVDLLSVYINGFKMIEGTQYTKNENSVTFINALEKDNEVHFVALRTIAATSADYELLKGDKGDTGEQGLQGIQGEIGPQGIQGETGPQGPQGIQGIQGEPGNDGITPKIQVGTTTTLEAGSDATVTQRGTTENPIFDFGIPKGADGTGGGGSIILKRWF